MNLQPRLNPRPRIAAFDDADDALAALLGGRTSLLAREAALADPAILQMTRDLLREQLPAAFLDPFAPAEQRNRAVIETLRNAISADKSRNGPLARLPSDEQTLLALFAATIGWGPAQRYLDDPAINEVKIIGAAIRVQEAGQSFVTVEERFGGTQEVLDRAVLLASILGIQLDAQSPQATLPLAHGTRMHVSIPPRTPDGALVCIRRGRSSAWDLGDLLARGTLNQPVAELIRLLCAARCSLLIAGRTGSGKTGLLEAIANSWPGEPHILSIEDHTMEIGIRNRAGWTRELLDTQRDPQAFSEVMREALRQTPDLLLPGEVRGNEAGAILALALTGHPVITTIHARGCSEALERFAGCAALPGAYMYAGRAQALPDTCAAFDAVLRIEQSESDGRRLLSEIVLVDGVSPAVSGRAQVIPLVSLALDNDGTAVWHCYAQVIDGRLYWNDGQERTPAGLQARLQQARRVAAVGTRSATLDTIQDALERAERQLLAGEAARALAILRSAWMQRREQRLLALAQRALSRLPDTEQLATGATLQRVELERACSARLWESASQIYHEITSEIIGAALAAPPEGWSAYAARIEAGRALLANARQLFHEATAALAREQPRAALDLLAQLAVNELPSEIALELLLLRERALSGLVARGESAPQSLQALSAQRAALERELHLPATESGVKP